MDKNTYIWLAIFGTFLVTYLLRIIPMAALKNVKFPKAFEIWLSYVPTAIFGALIFSEIFVAQGKIISPIGNIAFYTSAIVLCIAVKTKSLGASAISGLGLFALFKYLLT